MSELFFIGDTHFGHKNVLTFEHNGEPLRPFADLEEMHETIVERWNATVSPDDKIYHLGDVAFSKPGIRVMGRLNGRKRLIRGNHDLLKLNVYREYFNEVYGVRQIDGYWLTHVPISEHMLDQPRVKANVHGHTHALTLPNPLYVNVSVEAINYTPLSFEEVRDRAEMAMA